MKKITPLLIIIFLILLNGCSVIDGFLNLKETTELSSIYISMELFPEYFDDSGLLPYRAIVFINEQSGRENPEDFYEELEIRLDDKIFSHSENLFRYTDGELYYAAGDKAILSITHPSFGSYEKELTIPEGDSLILDPYQAEYSDWLNKTHRIYCFYLDYEIPGYDFGSYFLERYAAWEGEADKSRLLDYDSRGWFRFRVDQTHKYNSETNVTYQYFRMINSLGNKIDLEDFAEGSQILINGVMFHEISNVGWE